MILSNKDITKFIEKGKIKIEPLEEEQIGSASVDLTIDNKWWFFSKAGISTDSLWKDHMNFVEKDQITLKPREMCLGITKEKITLAEDVAGLLQGRSRYARLGLSVHVTSAFVHPGVSNHQVLEIINNSPYDFTIKAGARISQIIFFTTISKTTKPYMKIGEISVNQ